VTVKVAPASVAGIYVVTDPERRLAWVGQTQNFALRSHRHLRDGIYGEKLTEARMLEEISVDEWDQEYVGDAELDWMADLEDQGWTLLNRSRARNPYGGTSSFEERSRRTKQGALRRGDSWRASISRKMRQQHERWAIDQPDEYRARQRNASLASPHIITDECHKLGGHTAGTALMKRRRQCNECDMISTPTGIGTHQKASGHSGWEEVTG
jgi:hypothetical protein